MKSKEAINLVSKDLNIPEEVVKKAYIYFWKFIRDKIQNLPLKENLNEEEFNKLRTNFNIPSLGKLSCSYERYLGIKKRYNYLKNRNDKN